MGVSFSSYITTFDHWIAFILLGFLGGKMIYESFGEEETTISSFFHQTLLTLGVATSIDALAVGVSMAFLKTSIYFPCLHHRFRDIRPLPDRSYQRLPFRKNQRYQRRIIRGIILIAIGVKILIEHLME